MIFKEHNGCSEMGIRVIRQFYKSICMNVIAAHSEETLHATEICEQPNPLELPLMCMGLHPLSFNMMFKENYGCLEMVGIII